MFKDSYSVLIQNCRGYMKNIYYSIPDNSPTLAIVKISAIYVCSTVSPRVHKCVYTNCRIPREIGAKTRTTRSPILIPENSYKCSSLGTFGSFSYSIVVLRVHTATYCGLRTILLTNPHARALKDLQQQRLQHRLPSSPSTPSSSLSTVAEYKIRDNEIPDAGRLPAQIR